MLGDFMTKLLLEANKEIRNIDNFVGIIIGLKNYSVGYKCTVDINDIDDFLNKYKNYEVFLAINKNISNDELEDIKKILLKLNKTNIKAVLFYDLSILYLKQELNLDLDLVWNQTHMVTNYNTCNYYYNEGCKYAYLSSEITLDEMLEIIKKSSISTIIKVFGYSTIAHSKRKLLTNYFKHINKTKKKDIYQIEEKNLNSKYSVLESQNGTTIFEGKLLNGIKPLFELNEKADYLVMEDDGSDDFKTVSTIYSDALNKKTDEEEAIKKVEEIYPDTTTGFFYKKTIYKVKKDEKN